MVKKQPTKKRLGCFGTYP